MAILTVRPNSVSTTGTITRTGGTTNPGVLADDSDATYLTFATNNASIVVGFADPVIPAGRFPYKVRLRWRTQDVGGSDGLAVQGTLYAALQTDFTVVGTSLHNGSSGWVSVNAGGGPWTVAQLNAFTATFFVVVDSGTRLVEVWLEIEYTELPPEPENFFPPGWEIDPITFVGSATSDTDIPFFVADVDPQVQGLKTKVEFQIAQDTGFTLGVRSVTSPTLLTSGRHTVQLPEAQALTQGTWYTRARSVDELGTVSAWTNGAAGPYWQFDVSHPPNTTGHTPTGGTSRVYAANTTFTWQFTDPSPVDYQTAYQIQVETSADGILIADSGKVVSPNKTADVAIASTYKDTLLRWRIKVWDRDNVEGEWSNYNIFRIADRPVGTITAPAHNGTVNNPHPTITWTLTASNRTQAAYRIIVTNSATGAVVHDSGLKISSALTYTLPTGTLDVSTTYKVELIVTDSFGLTNTKVTGVSFNTFTTAWTPPAAPAGQTVSVASYEDNGYVSVQWSTSNRDTDFEYWRIYRRENGDAATQVLLKQISAPATVAYQDYDAENLVAYQYAVTQVVDRFGTILESARAWSGSFTPVSRKYWLIHLFDDTKNLRLDSVTDDSYTEEYDQEDHDLIGRGRNTEYGDRWGYSGSITVQIRDRTDKTARQIVKDLKTMKRERATVILRNPFGDKWRVSMGDINFTRVPGVGSQEATDVTIPYKEVVD